MQQQFSLDLLLKENLPGVVYRCKNDAHWTMEYLSAGITALTGYAPDDFTVQGHVAFGELIHPDDKELVSSLVQEAVQAGKSFQLTYRLRDRKEIWKWVWEQSTPVYDKQGQVIALEGFITDITAQKQVTDALARAEVTYRLTTEAAQVGIWEMEYATGDTAISPITAKILGLPPEKKFLTRQEWQSIMHPDDLPLMYKSYNTTMQTGEPFSLEYRQYHADGHLMWLSAKGITIQDEHKGAEKIIGTLIDITEQKRTEETLRAAKQRFQLLTEYSPDAILVDQDNVFVYANPAAAQLFGVECANALIGHSINEFLTPESLDVVHTRRPRLMEGKEKPAPIELQMRHANGTRLDIQAACGKISWDGKPAIQVMLRDVTELKKTREKLSRLSERLQLAIEGTGEGIWDYDIVNSVFTFSGGMNQFLKKEFNQTAYTLEEWRSAVHRNDIERVMATLQATLEGMTSVYECEYRLRANDGTWKWVLARGVVVERTDDGSPLTMTGTLTDISAKKESADLAWRHANLDPLTGLPNRRFYRERLDKELLRAERSHDQVALLFIDLDGFKQVNDFHGHDTGDVLLIEAAQRLKGCVRQTDTVARLGGDEFIVILSQLDDLEHVPHICQKILAALCAPFHIGCNVAHVSASIGVSMFPFDASTPDEMQRKADQAMYAAKQTGKNQFHYFTKELDDKAHFKLSATNELRYALERKQLSVCYQPVIDLKDGRICKAEALLRWQHPQLGAMGPADFIPLAEEAGLIKQIGNWVFQQAAVCAKHCTDITHVAFQIGVNKSPLQFIGQDSDSDWIGFLTELGLAGNSIAVEITEGVLLHTSAKVEDSLLAYRDAGIQVALDDFGTGYSSMSYLQKMDIDYLKIDQSFVKDITANPHSRAIAESIILMAHKLGLKVIAEGIETEEQRVFLLEAGCDYGQGYLFAPPLPEQELLSLVASAARCKTKFLQ